MPDRKRVDGWHKRFEQAVDEVKRRPFDWSRQHDCGLGFVVHIVKAISGVDHGRGFRGKYRSSRGALLVMKRAGFDDLSDMAASRLGSENEIHPSQARMGDVVAFADDSPFKCALGICNGERSLVLRPDGMGTLLTLSAKRAFRV